MQNKSPLTEIQPSSTTREELFIVLEYLKEYAYDEKHLSKQADIVRFAKDKYNYDFRRDRIPQILIHLSQMEKRLPFKVKAKKINKNYRFFLEKSFLTDNEIIDIIEALHNDQNKSVTKIKRLENNLLNSFVGKEKQKVIKDKTSKIISRGKHLDDAEQQKIELLKDAAYKKLFFTFKLKTNDFEISNDKRVVLNEIKMDHVLDGYVYAFLSFDKGPHVAIYSMAHKIVIVTSIESIELVTKPVNIGDWKKKIKFDINNTKFKSAGEWIENHYKGKTLENYEVVIAIKAGEENQIKKSFETYFATKMVPDTSSRLTVKAMDGSTKTIRKRDDFIYIKFTTNLPSVQNWFLSDKKIMFNVVIVEPALFPNELFSAILDNRKAVGLDNSAITESLK